MNGKKETLKLPCEVYEKVLQEIIEKELNLLPEDCIKEYAAGSAKGDNYLGIVYRINVKSKKDKNSFLNVIAKLPPQNASRREQFSANFCFLRECQFYDIIVPMYKEFQIEKGINVETDGFHHTAKCYKTFNEEPTEGIFLEDLKPLNFEMFDRLKEVTKDQVFLVMKTLAKLHAISFAIQDQKPDKIKDFTEMIDFFTHQCYKDNSGMKLWFEKLMKQGLDVLRKSKNPDLIKRVENALQNNLELVVRECTNSKEIFPYAAISHGDCWNNNIMYKYDENGEAVDIRLLDFQILRYATPVCDLMYYIFGCTRKSLRDKYYQEFIDVYYEELSSFIIRLGSDPKKVYPREIFDEQLKKFGKFGLAMAMILLPIFTSDVDDVPDLDDLAEKLQELQSTENGHKEFDEGFLEFTSSKTIDKYEERMMGVFIDMYNLDYV
ncbi:hypothetical protein PVAND_001793 [Polypedilum vanderplanki]|uniref:CHK kinase-like domain-containing protein n=1 Tax=Polypedilum vanderplanki TaxID=319348 RepID=A0A9J6BPG7_POLVA|nr:hypothetical protein PVAND_001793 [Polypedilum vanderplanki]